MATALAEPRFQSYISGHSTFSMAAAITLADFFGTDNISFCTDADPNAHDAANNPFAETRCFTSFTAAAFEAGAADLSVAFTSLVTIFKGLPLEKGLHAKLWQTLSSRYPSHRL